MSLSADVGSKSASKTFFRLIKKKKEAAREESIIVRLHQLRQLRQLHLLNPLTSTRVLSVHAQMGE